MPFFFLIKLLRPWLYRPAADVHILVIVVDCISVVSHALNIRSARTCTSLVPSPVYARPRGEGLVFRVRFLVTNTIPIWNLRWPMKSKSVHVIYYCGLHQRSTKESQFKQLVRALLVHDTPSQLLRTFQPSPTSPTVYGIMKKSTTLPLAADVSGVRRYR